MDYILGEDWEITPAGGATGKAFFARHREQQLFLKRNSSPFLAVLSAEGIVPKLVWTKRLENGDVITAQQWKSGRELQPAEMGDKRVAKLLKKIHTSKPLLSMLLRLGKTPVHPERILAQLGDGLDRQVAELPSIRRALLFLQKEVGNVHHDEQVVCHCDLNHNNWLLGKDSRLYLIDWDGAMVGDPAIDLGMLLYWYIPEENWEDWLNRYGIALTDSLRLRMKWYVTAETIESVQWHKLKGRHKEMEKWEQFLTNLV
ncbi:phosphotransferase [Neobacillus notoginsengisoli]|uniref:Phosphotransferase n=1 Tax=Neobacillus notoginsengisoli TaxID=1578198 RepID=A0A417YUC8_9BACI|nr:phosphotransferase family protein [Neobacillus notoginsengisoli]RHW40791.1 phosphotransferase [Neobacillus notoginsengisoli]